MREFCASNHGAICLSSPDILDFPRKSSAPPFSEPPAPCAPIPRGTETILLVDDEPIIRDMASDLLQRLGYTVHLASDGLDALERFQELRGEVEAVLLDASMPRMGGLECLRQLQKLKPDIRVLLTSGHDLISDLNAQQIPGAWGFIQKPYRFSELAHCVRTLLDT
jgi:CheY-like chemotaxis protein